MAQIRINNMDVTVPDGITILEACKLNNINIPTLCNYPDLHINGECRVCVVEVEGQHNLPTSCSTQVQDGMKIKTNSARVLNARKTTTEMILANHDVNCTSCVRNLNCELQNLTNALGINTDDFETVLELKSVDNKDASIVRNPNRCIKCGRCIEVCKEVQGIGVLEFVNRGNEISVSPAYGLNINEVFCTKCGQCSNVCPVGAIIEQDDTDRVWEALNDDSKHVIVQTAPAIRVSLGESLGLPKGSIVIGALVSSLRMLGFDRVFDTDFTADLTILEEGTELIGRIKNGGTLPMFTSCCPGWINFLENKYPDLLDHISSCKSPQQMFGSVAKTYYAEKQNIDPKDLFVVSVMPCTAKKSEAIRPEMSVNGKDPDVDVVITTRELARMIKQMGIDFDNIPETEFDSPFGITTGAAAIFGATGGVMEAALRTVAEVLNEKPLENLDFEVVRGMDGIKVAEVELAGNTYRVAVAHTLSKADQLMQEVRNGTSPYHFIEVMACPGGCIGGGGQPYGTTNAVRAERIETTYRLDANMPLRKSHESPAVQAIYKEYFTEPNSHKAHDLLHTHYFDRSKKY